ncbi:hypothetical protein BDP55DRAFT_630713 [Colletotrichum godetiae]|uniref:Mtf2-like C-terminal domain-containing protein n=1 Tax=Colletotrichum godetiae TaxID=1209918 RepID=A0AAJ0EVD9_9PEZI|nr:uncharacterized protein BDP55DRAFT_630713 [Colletotrichum godetiae]KAK1687520.1 hypothetical protein BDP55DRAFT_630713 [Colletotrichum godetiae]
MATTLTPFLYQTRTILRGSVSIRSLSTTAGRLHAHPRGRGQQSIPFEWDGPAQERTDIPSGPDGERKSTITPTERQVFRAIFDDIAKRSGQALPQPTPDAADDASSSSQIEPEPESGSRDAILRKYPPALRRAAEVALGMRQIQGDQLASSRISFKPEEELESDLAEAAKLDAARRDARAQEAVRLQALLDQCNTDVEVWTVLERDVFSMVARLGISEDQNHQPDPEKKAKPAQKKKSSKKAQPDALSMDSHGPLYSMHLLQGLKTLDQSFAHSSPLALNVLPRVKDLGLASYVLGVSTPFYNELASILWYRHGDTQAVLAVLDEMQFAGLFYDMQTLRLVDTIELALDSFRGGKLGVFSKAVGTMPGYNLDVKSKVARYARRVRHSLREHNGSARY